MFYGLVGGVALLLWHRFPGKETYEDLIEQNADMHHYFNLLVGLLLVFRTTTSYSRYEAGVLAAGTLKTSARTLVSQAVAHTGATEDAQFLTGHVGGDTAQPPPQRFVINCQRLTLLYGLMFKRHLHRQDAKPLPVLIHKGLLREDEMRTLSDAPPCCRTLIVMQWLRNVVAEAARAGLLDGPSLQLLDGTVNALVQNYQAASRVAFVGTPLPWRQAVKVVISLYCFVCPFAFVRIVGFATPAVSFVFALLIFSIEEVAVEIEDPFGRKTTPDGDLDKSPDVAEHYVNLEKVITQIDEDCARLVQTRIRRPIRYVHHSSAFSLCLCACTPCVRIL
eukprot:COSAG02_NODE_243_length_27457_cov_16.852328_2_plen_335_part_00